MKFNKEMDTPVRATIIGNTLGFVKRIISIKFRLKRSDKRPNPRILQLIHTGIFSKGIKNFDTNVTLSEYFVI